MNKKLFLIFLPVLSSNTQLQINYKSLELRNLLKKYLKYSLRYEKKTVIWQRELGNFSRSDEFFIKNIFERKLTKILSS